ncbi:hypothetical protein CC2G_001496 [Coprinopsis cinerea AmutBmut pab1-1]|nr:hypothetical protein CC2G_001496 [Coprinopsis cinerea AmutBmut pab1-1]
MAAESPSNALDDAKEPEGVEKNNNDNGASRDSDTGEQDDQPCAVAGGPIADAESVCSPTLLSTVPGGEVEPAPQSVSEEPAGPEEPVEIGDIGDAAGSVPEPLPTSEEKESVSQEMPESSPSSSSQDQVETLASTSCVTLEDQKPTDAPAPESASSPPPLPDMQTTVAQAVAAFRPSPRDVISGIAPHLFDERRRRANQPRRSSVPTIYLYKRRPKASPLRKCVVIHSSLDADWDAWEKESKERIARAVPRGMRGMEIYFSKRGSKASSSSNNLLTSPHRASIIDINLGVGFKSPLAPSPKIVTRSRSSSRRRAGEHSRSTSDSSHSSLEDGSSNESSPSSSSEDISISGGRKESSSFPWHKLKLRPKLGKEGRTFSFRKLMVKIKPARTGTTATENATNLQ